ncbi:uncharacterized protein LOC143343046 [Colletes latitarsis]|uniref:uncharacterized protein LOC143343046 n=1 Tax=Colletes latitarsis TaxID=2605962 RepID=UPI0040355D3A
MSARFQREIHETSPTKKFFTPRLGGKNREPQPPPVFDYFTAISKPDVSSVFNRTRNGRNTTTRSRAPGTKSCAQRKGKQQSPDSKNSNPAKNATASNERKDVGEKGNGTVDDDKLSNLLKKNAPAADGNVDTTTKAIENNDEHRTTEKKAKNERSDCENAAAKSPVLQVKGSRIPRAKMPVNTIHEVHPVANTDLIKTIKKTLKFKF